MERDRHNGRERERDRETSRQIDSQKIIEKTVLMR